VRRLVLCASYPGNGTAVPPSRQAINALTSNDPQQVMADLFPAGQTVAQNTYLAAISSYPAAPAAPANTVTAQGNAVDQWWAGSDPAGQQAAKIAVPTLIADSMPRSSYRWLDAGVPTPGHGPDPAPCPRGCVI